MGSELDVKPISMVQSDDVPITESSSEISDTTNGIKDNGKLVDELSKKGLHDASSTSVPIIGDSENNSDVPSNGQLDNHFDSGSGMEASVHDATKDIEVSDQGDDDTIVKAARVAVGTVDPISPSNVSTEYNINRILIDTTAPFESVKEAVSKFGGIVDWKAHKVQTVERRKIIEQELKKVQQEIPLYKEQSEVAEQSKIQLLADLENTKRFIEDLKLSLERAQTEEHQAKQDSELAHLRIEELEQGIAHEASVAAKTQLQVAKSRHEAAISDLKTVKEELLTLRSKYENLLTEKNDAEKKALEAVSKSKEAEKTVEELTVELISTKELLESAHAAHLEAEEHRIGAAVAKDQDSLTWAKELKQAEDDLTKINIEIESAEDLKSKLNTASALLTTLKAELASYMESKISQEVNGGGTIAAANKELEDVKVNIEKATDEVNCLEVAATSLKPELEKEKSELDNIKQRGSISSAVVSSLEAELDRIKSEISMVETREKEAKEKMMELPKQLEHASQETDEAKLAAALAREELRRAQEEVEKAKAGANTMETQLLAAQKEIEASRASERLAIAAIKALQESDSTQIVTSDEDTRTSNGVTLSLQEYYALSKRAHEAEEEANTKVANAMSQIEVAKISESRSLTQLEEANKEVEERKETLRIAMEKAEKAKEGKLGVEQELRSWRAENEQRRKDGELGQNPRKSIEEGNWLKGEERLSNSSLYTQEFKIEKVVDSTSPPIPFGQGLGLKNLAGLAKRTMSSQQATTPESFSEESSVSSPKATFGQSDTVRKRRRSLFPRFFMFLARRKSSSKAS